MTPPQELLLRKKVGVRVVKPLSAVVFASSLLACKPAVPAGPAEPWGSFNGFSPGMSLEAAKAAGARDCKDGDLGYKKITCKFPVDRMRLDPFAGASGSLDFFAYQNYRLRFYVFCKSFWGSKRAGSKDSCPFQIAKATRSSLRPRMIIACVAAKPLLRIDSYKGLSALL